jgi:hypothetical protein
MVDQAAYAAGLAQGNADAINRQSSPAPQRFEGNADYDAGYAEGMANPSGPVSEPAPTDPAAVRGAGLAQGARDQANQSSSETPPEHEGSKDYAKGYNEADPAYAAGVAAGRADTVQKRSSMTPPEYEGNEAYAQGYAEGLAAPPYLSDLEAQEAAEKQAIEDSQRAMMPKLPPLVITPPGDMPIYDENHPKPPSMGPAEPGQYPRPGEGEDGEMPHAEYGKRWDPKTQRWLEDGEYVEGEGGPEIIGD